MILVGPFLAKSRAGSTGPIRASSSSWQILMKWSEGLTWTFLPALPLAEVCTTSPRAFSFTRSTKVLATVKSTSASRRATRMSRTASAMPSSVISLRPARRFRAALNPRETVSSMGRS